MSFQQFSGVVYGSDVERLMAEHYAAEQRLARITEILVPIIAEPLDASSMARKNDMPHLVPIKPSEARELLALLGQGGGG